MNKDNFRNYKQAVLTFKIETFQTEKFINYLWRKGVHIKKIRKINLTTFIMEADLKDFETISEAARLTKSRIIILKRRGFSFLLIKLRKRVALGLGAAVFVGIICYLSTYVWIINIVPDKYVSPYEIRQQLNSFGIKPGINKSKVNIFSLEEKLLKINENLMWVKVRTDGAGLKIEFAEKIIPPTVSKEETISNLVAKKDGQIVRVYTSSGTAVVKAGDIVKKGDMLVKGEQGKEEATYQVPSKGTIIAKTFYEANKTLPYSGTKVLKTGKKVTNYFIMINGKRVYIKNTKINFQRFQMVVSGGFINKETYYEIKEAPYTLNISKLVKDASDELYTNIIVNLDKSVKIVDKAVESSIEGKNCKVRIVVTVEENIAEQQK